MRFRVDNAVLTNDAPPPAGAIPEPSIWAMGILGFGAAGAIIRRRGRGEHAPAV